MPAWERRDRIEPSLRKRSDAALVDERRVKELHGDVAFETTVVAPRPPDGAHAAGADALDELVGAERPALERDRRRPRRQLQEPRAQGAIVLREVPFERLGEGGVALSQRPYELGRAAPPRARAPGREGATADSRTTRRRRPRSGNRSRSAEPDAAALRAPSGPPSLRAISVLLSPSTSRSRSIQKPPLSRPAGSANRGRRLQGRNDANEPQQSPDRGFRGVALALAATMAFLVSAAGAQQTAGGLSPVRAQRVANQSGRRLPARSRTITSAGPSRWATSTATAATSSRPESRTTTVRRRPS